MQKMSFEIGNPTVKDSIKICALIGISFFREFTYKISFIPVSEVQEIAANDILNDQAIPDEMMTDIRPDDQVTVEVSISDGLPNEEKDLETKLK